MTSAEETGAAHARRRFEEEVWAVTIPRLTRYLRKFAGPDDAADAAQATAVKAIAAVLPFQDADDLLRWCQVVGQRHLIDQHRRRSNWGRLVPIDFDIADEHDAIEAVHTQAVLGNVLALIKTFPTAERAAMEEIISEAPPHADRKSQLRAATARKRARKRLGEAIRYPLSLVGLVTVLRRRLTGAGTATSAVLVACLLVLPVVAQHGGGEDHAAMGPPGAGDVAPLVPRPPPVTTQAPGRTPPRTIARPPVHSAQRVVPAAHLLSTVEAPLGISNTLTAEPAEPDSHLICTSGDLVPTVICVG